MSDVFSAQYARGREGDNPVMMPKQEIMLPEAAALQPIGHSHVVATQARTDQQLLNEWLNGYDGHTRSAYERIAFRFLDELQMPLSKATIEDYRRAVERLGLKPDGQQASRSTRATYTAATKSFLGFAHGVGYLAFNVAPFLKIEKAPRELAKRIVSQDDIDDLLLAPASERDRLLLAVGYFGGLRVSELVKLQWGDLIERENGLMQIASLEGKGGKVREVLLPAFVSDKLRSARGSQTDHDPIFRSQRHDGAISRQAAHGIIKAAAKKAGITEAISTHWLRHAHISHALDEGAPISLVSQSVGHASLKTTSVYAHARPDDSSGLYLADHKRRSKLSI